MYVVYYIVVKICTSNPARLHLKALFGNPPARGSPFENSTNKNKIELRGCPFGNLQKSKD